MSHYQTFGKESDQDYLECGLTDDNIANSNLYVDDELDPFDKGCRLLSVICIVFLMFVLVFRMIMLKF